jgi:sugar (pentulose or hexulose) kinase
VFDVRGRRWDDQSIAVLGLPRDIFPEVREAARPAGVLVPKLAESLGLPSGLPVWPAIGDNQAAFLGCVRDRDDGALVNVGTGGQVAAYTDKFMFAPPLETRPFPVHGYLLVNAGLCGGRSYALLEHFFQEVARQVFGQWSDAALYETMNRLAASVPHGADGLRCEPLFTGTREDPSLRGSWTGIAPGNFTPAHVIRSLLEGMGRSFMAGLELIRNATGRRFTSIVGAGNGLRENAVLAEIVAKECGLPLTFPKHREEAAVGAARLCILATD